MTHDLDFTADSIYRTTVAADTWRGEDRRQPAIGNRTSGLLARSPHHLSRTGGTKAFASRKRPGEGTGM